MPFHSFEKLIHSRQRKLLLDVSYKTASIEEVYLAAIGGINYRRTEFARISSKLGSKIAKKSLGASDLKDFNRILEIRDKEEKKTHHLKNSRRQEKNMKLSKLLFSRRETTLVRKATLVYFRMQRRIPELAREQYVISLDAVFEGFIMDTLQNIFDHIPDAMKSAGTTLKDEEVIDSLKDDKGPLGLLKERKIRDLMFGGSSAWIRFFQQNLKLNVKMEDSLNELNLVRNCLIHNKGRVSDELQRAVKKNRYRRHSVISVTVQDLERYKNSVRALCSRITKEVEVKFKL